MSNFKKTRISNTSVFEEILLVGVNADSIENGKSHYGNASYMYFP